MADFHKAIVDFIFNTTGFFLRLVFKLFGLSLLKYTGNFWSRLSWHRHPERNAEIEKELKRLFPGRFDGEQIKDLVKKSVDNYCRKQVEYLFFGYFDRKKIEKLVRVEGLENLDQALAGGKGVILLLSHFGSFLLPLPFLAYRGYKVNQITGKDQHASLVQERFWLWRKREANRLPVNFIQVGNFLKPIYQRLKKNEIVAVAFDGRQGTKWIPVKIFDRTALISPGPINLALKTGAVIVPTFIIRDHDGHRLILEPPFELERAGENLLEKNVKKFSRIFTKYLWDYPCHMGVVLQLTSSRNQSGRDNPLFLENDPA